MRQEQKPGKPHFIILYVSFIIVRYAAMLSPWGVQSRNWSVFHRELFVLYTYKHRHHRASEMFLTTVLNTNINQSINSWMDHIWPWPQTIPAYSSCSLRSRCFRRYSPSPWDPQMTWPQCPWRWTWPYPPVHWRQRPKWTACLSLLPHSVTCSSEMGHSYKYNAANRHPFRLNLKL